MLKKLIRDKEFFSKITIEPVPKNTSLLFKIIKKDFERLKKDKEICKKDQEIQKLNNIIDDVRKYLTSCESMEIIGQYENPKSNKGLDEKTMVEMIRRYLIIHDNLLDILELKEGK